MARKREVVTQALRRLNVVAYDESPDQAQYVLGLAYFDQALADLGGDWGGCTFAFDPDEDIPTVYVSALADFLANRLSPVFERPAPMAEITALMRVRAVNVPYTRDMDLDEDGTTDDEEIEAVDRSAYY